MALSIASNSEGMGEEEEMGEDGELDGEVDEEEEEEEAVVKDGSEIGE